MNHEIRDKLLDAEPQDPALRAEYERRLSAMLETPLTLPRKTGLTFGTIVSLATAVIAGVLAVRLRHFSAAAAGGLAICGLISLGAALVTGRILVRGTYRHDRDSSSQAGLIWVFVVIMVTTFMLVGGIDSIRGVGLTVVGIVFLIGAAVMLLRTVIEQSELRTREKLLELELRLTKIGDELSHLRRGPG